MGFPQAIVQLADAILQGEDRSAARAAVNAYLSDLLAWLDQESDFWVSDEDAEAIARSRALMIEVERTTELRVLSREEWSRRLVEVTALLTSYTDRVRLARTQTYFFKIPVLDQLVVASIALLSGRARPDCLERRYLQSAALVSELRQQFEELSDSFPEDRDAMDSGLEQLQTGLDGILQWLETSEGSLKEATRQILAGGAQVESLYLACHKRDTVDTGMLEADAHLSRLLRAAAVGSEAEFGIALQSYNEEGEELVMAAWAQERARLLVPTRLQAQCVHSIEQALDLVQAACQAGERKKIWRSIKNLEVVKARLTQRSLKLDGAAGTILEAPVQALAGAVRQDMPRIMLVEVARAFADENSPPGTQRVRALVDAYLKNGNPSRLLEALELLLQLAEEMARPGYALNGLVCRCCGQTYSFGAEQNFCVKPGRNHTYLDVSA